MVGALRRRCSCAARQCCCGRCTPAAAAALVLKGCRGGYCCRCCCLLQQGGRRRIRRAHRQLAQASALVAPACASCLCAAPLPASAGANSAYTKPMSRPASQPWHWWWRLGLLQCLASCPGCCATASVHDQAGMTTIISSCCVGG